MGLIKSAANKLAGQPEMKLRMIDWSIDLLDAGEGRILLFYHKRGDGPQFWANDFIEEVPPGTMMEPIQELGFKMPYSGIGGRRIPIEQYRLVGPDEDPNVPIEECIDVPEVLLGNPPYRARDPGRWDEYIREIS